MNTSPFPVESRWALVLRHGRLWRRCFALAIVREMQYRASFVSIILVGLAQIVLGLVPIVVLYDHVSLIDDWSRADMIVVLGLFQTMDAMLECAVFMNMYEVPQGVRHGSLDMMLVRPINHQFYATTRWVQPQMIFSFAGGVAVTIVGLTQGRGMPSAEQLLQMLILMGAGLVLLGCVCMAVAYLAFWLTDIGALINFFRGEVLVAGRYPVTIFPMAFRLVLTVVVPMAFAVTFPAQAITRGISWWVVLAGVALAVIAVWMLRRLWRVAIRRYSSASS